MKRCSGFCFRVPSAPAEGGEDGSARHSGSVCVGLAMARYSRGESFGGSAPLAEAAVSSKLYPMSDLVGPEWRSREQLEPSPPSTSPAYWDTDEDDDSNSSCVTGIRRSSPY